MLKRVSTENGLWPEVMSSWEVECDFFGENLEEYASASLPVLDDLAIGTQTKSAGVYGLFEGDTCVAICQANSSFLPRYTGKVLRIRHIVFSPRFDFADDIEVDDYMNVLVGVFVGVLNLSVDEMESPHIKFHLRSPAERQFGEEFTAAVVKSPAFDNAEMKGSWIYLTKT